MYLILNFRRPFLLEPHLIQPPPPPFLTMLFHLFFIRLLAYVSKWSVACREGWTGRRPRISGGPLYRGVVSHLKKIILKDNCKKRGWGRGEGDIQTRSFHSNIGDGPGHPHTSARHPIWSSRYPLSPS